MKRIASLSVLVFVILFAVGCSQHVGNFTAMSSANYEPKNIDAAHLKKAGAEGRASSLLIFGIPIGGMPKIDQAVAETLKKENGDFLQNCSVYYSQWNLIFFGQVSWKVTGDVYKTK